MFRNMFCRYLYLSFFALMEVEVSKWGQVLLVVDAAATKSSEAYYGIALSSLVKAYCLETIQDITMKLWGCVQPHQYFW